jgi:hypothetical protein
MGSAIRSPSGANACKEASQHTTTLNAESTPLQHDAFAGNDWRHRTLLPRERLTTAEDDADALVKDITVGVAPQP